MEVILDGDYQDTSRGSVAFVDLHQKYDRPGPRYTSFPSYLFWENWDSPHSEEAWIRQLSEEMGKIDGQSEIGLYIHVPFCEHLCLYCGCNRKVTRDHSQDLFYIKAIFKEWEYYQKLLGPLRIREIHLGGGTPTFLHPENLKLLLDGILSHPSSPSSSSLLISAVDPLEGSVEIDPRVTTLDHYKVFQSYGFKKLSMGIQDFDPQVQKIINRIQGKELVQRQVQLARELGIEEINFDLIHGLPGQSKETIQKTFAVVQNLRPDTLSFYGYAHTPWKNPWQRHLEKWPIPAGQYKRELYEEGRRRLFELGYLEIGMDHFALPSARLYQAYLERRLGRSFMGYGPRKIPFLIGLGASAISCSPLALAQNERQTEKYMERIHEGKLPVTKGYVLSPSDRVIANTIEEILCYGKANLRETVLHLPRWFIPAFKAQMSDLLRDGLVTIEQGGLKVTELGRPFIRNVCMSFDYFLGPNDRAFGRTV